MRLQPFHKVLFVATIILLLVPIAAWISAWHWQNQYIDHLSTWILLTNTAALPWGLVSIAVFCALLYWTLGRSLSPKTLLISLLLLAMAVGGGQVVKVIVKDTLKEPRPYVIWLDDNQIISSGVFYGMDRGERKDWLVQHESGLSVVPEDLQAHWQSEVGFSFPSGHSLFAATWALLAVCLWWTRKQYFLAAMAMVWAEWVLISRLFLGMHWPIDIVVGVLISAVLAFLFVPLLNRQLGKNAIRKATS